MGTSGNEIDQLWHFITTAEAEDLAAMAPKDLDAVIAYQRRARAASDAGVKPKKGTEDKIDLTKLGLAMKEEPIKRRKL